MLVNLPDGYAAIHSATFLRCGSAVLGAIRGGDAAPTVRLSSMIEFIWLGEAKSIVSAADD